jgi:hypothetical protein
MQMKSEPQRELDPRIAHPVRLRRAGLGRATLAGFVAALAGLLFS